MDIGPTFCVVPWVQLATNATGNYRICCNGIPGKNLVLDENDRPMKVAEHSADKVWKSKSYVSLRESLLNGERPEMCQRCFREEDAGVESARQKWNAKWIKDEEYSLTPEFKVKYIDLRLGNLCNLKCRMCNPYASSKWVNDWNQVVGTAKLVPNNPLAETEIDRLKNLDWHGLEVSWRNLQPALEQVDEIYLTGGEPFLSLKQIDFLKILIEKDISQSIRLKYNTNLTTLPKSLLEIWPNFKKVQLNVSIDGIGELDEYIRYPSKWCTIEKNLHQLYELENKFPEKIKVGIHCTVQMYNICHLGELLEYFASNFNKFPYLNILNHPKCLNIRTLPAELKAESEEILGNWMGRKEVKEVVAYMNAEDWHEDYFGEFIKYTKAIDQQRNQSLFNFNTEFQNFCKD